MVMKLVILSTMKIGNVKNFEGDINKDIDVQIKAFAYL